MKKYTLAQWAELKKYESEERLKIGNEIKRVMSDLEITVIHMAKTIAPKWHTTPPAARTIINGLRNGYDAAYGSNIKQHNKDLATKGYTTPIIFGSDVHRARLYSLVETLGELKKQKAK